jgi:prepilin-type N-terminal cleavage/methylation domain-containing protein
MRKAQGEEGFTLMELMVVVLIIAVLLSIAVPSFLAARGRAQHRAAEASLRNALVAEITPTVESGLEVDATDPRKGVVLRQGAPDAVCLTRVSADGQTFAIWESAVLGTWFGTGDLTDPTACPVAAGPAPSAFTRTGWTT